MKSMWDHMTMDNMHMYPEYDDLRYAPWALKIVKVLVALLIVFACCLTDVVIG